MRKSVNITIVSKPSTVEFQCPYCSEENGIDWEDWIDNQYSDDWYDWEITICTNCGNELKISSVDYD